MEQSRQADLAAQVFLDAGPQLVEKLVAMALAGDASCLRTAVQYVALTAKEREDIAQADALQRFAESAGTDAATLLHTGMTDRIARALGIEALAVMRMRALKGDLQAARYLCDRSLGEPTQTVTLRSATMTAEEAREALVAEYLADGLEEAEARRMAALGSAKPAALAQEEDGE